MKLTKPQQQIANDKNRWRILVAGRRFGKTFLAIREMCYFARQPNKTIFYFAPSYRMCRNIVWGPLKERLFELKWIKKINESDLRIDLINGSQIFLRSGDNVDSVRGTFCSGIAVFDEFADMDPEIWTVMRPALADKGGHAMWIGTPKGKGNHFYDLYTWAQAQDGWSTYKYTTADGGNVPLAELEAARKDLDEKQYQQEFMADWVDYVGLVYYAFNELNVQKWKGEIPKVLEIGNDFNISPMSAVVSVRTPQGLHVIDEIELFNSNTFEMAEEIKKRYPNTVINCYPDPSGASRRTASNTTDHKILYNAGFNVFSRRAHPPVRDRINSVNSAFSSGKLIIDPKCKSLMNCLHKLSYREGTNEQDKNSGLDHLTDALGYCTEYLYPIKRQITPRVEPQRWAINAGPVRRFG